MMDLPRGDDVLNGAERGLEIKPARVSPAHFAKRLCNTSR